MDDGWTAEPKQQEQVEFCLWFLLCFVCFAAFNQSIRFNEKRTGPVGSISTNTIISHLLVSMKTFPIRLYVDDVFVVVVVF